MVGRQRAGGRKSRNALRNPVAGARLRVDADGRITLPPQLRGEFFLIPNRERTMVRMFRPAELQMVARWVETCRSVSPRDRAIFIRHFFASAHVVATDGYGRLTIPRELRAAYDLSGEVRIARPSTLALELFSPRLYGGSRKRDASPVEPIEPAAMTPGTEEGGAPAPAPTETGSEVKTAEPTQAPPPAESAPPTKE